MERKKISVKTETKIRKKEDSQVQTSDARLVRRTKIETLTETCIIETEVVRPLNIEGRCSSQREPSARTLGFTGTESEISTTPSNSEDDCNETVTHGAAQERYEQERNAPLDMKNATLTEPDSMIKKMNENESQNSSVKEDKEDASSTDGRCSSSDSYSSFDKICTYVDSKASPDKLYGKEYKFNEKCSETVGSNKFVVDEMTPLHAQINVSISGDSQNDDEEVRQDSSITKPWSESPNTEENEVNIVNAKLEEYEVGTNIGIACDNTMNDRYNKGDFNMILPKDNEMNIDNEDQEKQNPDRSVSYLVSYFESISNNSRGTANLKISEMRVKENNSLESGGCREGLLKSTNENMENKFCTFGCLESGDSDIVNMNLNLSTLKNNFNISESTNEDVERGAVDTEVTSDIRKDERFLNSNENSEPILVKRMSRLTANNLNRKFRQPKKVRFIFPNENETDLNNNINETSDSDVMKHWLIRKHVEPQNCQTKIAPTELQPIEDKENDGFSGAQIPLLKNLQASEVNKRSDLKESGSFENEDFKNVKNDAPNEKNPKDYFISELKERKKKASLMNSKDQMKTSNEKNWKSSEWKGIMLGLLIGFLLINFFDYLLNYLNL